MKSPEPLVQGFFSKYNSSNKKTDFYFMFILFFFIRCHIDQFVTFLFAFSISNSFSDPKANIYIQMS